MLNTCQLEEYLQDVLVRLAHHSSAIEGNTITLPDTVSIISHNTLPGGYSRREFFEIENHRDAFAFVIDQLQDKQPLNLTVLKDIHVLVTIFIFFLSFLRKLFSIEFL